MIRVSLFCILVVTSVLALYGIALITPQGDPFADKSQTNFIGLGKMPQPTIASLKIRHAQRHRNFDIGLFGNSRILMVDAKAIKVAPARLFNFSLSSESFNGTVQLIDKLAEQSKLPKILVVGLDNLHLQRDNVPFWPNFIDRLQIATQNIATAAVEARFVDAARHIWRFGLSETIRFDNAFGPTTILTAISRAVSGDPNYLTPIEARTYRADGSQKPPAGKGKIAPILPSSSHLVMAQFERNLERLGTHVAAGHRVIIMETPIYPAFQQQLDAAPTRAVISARQLWNAACSKFGFYCVDAPLIPDIPSAPWFDNTHPPEASWGAFIALEIQKAAE